MNTSISFTVYGATRDELEAAAYARLAEYAGSDTKWSVNLYVSPAIRRADGTTEQWKADVSGWQE